MSINLLMGSAPFNRSYNGYFKPQLDAIDRRIVPAINRLISDSDRFAGPYRTEVRMGPVPGLGGSGTFIVLVRSAKGVPVPSSVVALDPSPGMTLHGSATVDTGPTGGAKVSYTAARTGRLSVIAAGRSMPNTTIRIGYSPTHNTNSFGSGSQRVALVSAHPLVPLPHVTGRVTVPVPALHTNVDGGVAGRLVGELVSDHVTGTGLGPHAVYRLSVTLQDTSGVQCGQTAAAVRTDSIGHLNVHTSGLPVCGGGTDTFAERLTLGRVTVGVSPPGQPAETFPVLPRITTTVVGGSSPRLVGTGVADQVNITGLPAGRVQVLAVLLDDTGRTCAHILGFEDAGPAGSIDTGHAGTAGLRPRSEHLR